MTKKFVSILIAVIILCTGCGGNFDWDGFNRALNNINTDLLNSNPWRQGQTYGNAKARRERREQSAQLGCTHRTKYDRKSGNEYEIQRCPSGWTYVRGYNPNNGSRWTTNIAPNGDMSGVDKDRNDWNYDATTTRYFNYGTGKTCRGKKPYRTCY